MGNWLPIHWISLQLGFALHGPEPGAFLLTNVFLHAFAALALFAALRQMTGALWRPAFVAAVFALHPLHVESVAWVSERKDVLAAVFFMAGLLAHARFAERPGSPARYLAVIACLVLGLLSKATLVVFPFVLLLLDAWPLGRLQQDPRRVVLEKAPMLALCLAVSVVTYLAQRAVGNMAIGDQLGFTARVVNAMQAYWLYLGDAFWPSGLAVIYPHPFVLSPVGASDLAIGLLLALGLLLGCVLALAAWPRHPYLLVGWLWYLGCLVPMIGFVHVGLQARADRYTYIPLVGLSIAVAWAGGWLAGRSAGWRRAVGLVGVACVLAMMVLTRTQLDYWVDSITLFTRAAAVTENNRFAHEKLAILLAAEGRNAEAAHHFEAALRVDPRRVTSQMGLAAVYERMGDDERAIEAYRRGLQLQPNKALAHGALGLLLVRNGRPAEAEEHLRYVLAALPREAEYHEAMGSVALRLDRPGEALHHYREALAISGESAELRASLASAQAARGERTKAARELERAELLARQRGDEALASELRQRRNTYAGELPAAD